MKPLSQTLSNLVVLAEELTTRPLINPLLLRDRCLTIGSEVRAADARPAESVRTTSAAMMMVMAIHEYRHAAADRAPMWLMLIGATLPLLRQAAFDAFAEENEQRMESRNGF